MMKIMIIMIMKSDGIEDNVVMIKVMTKRTGRRSERGKNIE